MKRILLSLSILICGLAAMNAQYPDASQLTPLPLNPKVKTGVLKNGLTYYIMHNEEPKERANFYIAQKVGSTLEEPDQLGLAHFLEHMAFNGTTNYPGKSMLNYLMSKGIRFGSDINAYTSFDETVYRINNVPTTDKNLMDSVLLVLHDWSGEILLEEAEIDAERGVIQEEWRSTTSPYRRQMEQDLPKIYKEYQYQQMPIGKMDVVMNFKPEVLRAYYKKWYRPDLQGIIVVGDFDADEMEKKVIDLFSTIEMPENAAKRVYPEVSDNEKPIYTLYTDPELSTLETMVSWKMDKTPYELRNTVEIYLQDQMLNSLISVMLNNRLADFAMEPDCDYTRAGVFFSDFLMSITKDSFNVRIWAKKDSKKSVEDALSVVFRALKTGFTQSEFDRASQEIMSNLENQLSEKDKTDNHYFGQELCKFFTEHNPAPGIEMEYQIWASMLPNIPIQMINMSLANDFYPELATGKNMVVMTSAPKAEGFEIATEEATLACINQVVNAEYEALQEETIDEPLVAELPKPGTMTKFEKNEALGTMIMTLSNGVKVVLKPTDFSNDEILMTAYRKGGKRLYAPEQAANVLMMEDAFGSSKFGPFDNKTMMKFLAGKNVDIDFSVNTFTDVISGSSTVKDLPVLFELIYTAFTNMNPDEDTYNVNVSRIRPRLENAEKDPNNVFRKEMIKTQYNNNPLMMPVTVETLDQANYLEAFDMAKGVLKNAAEYTFFFTGNINMETIQPLIEQYIATLPVSLRKKPVYKSEIELAQGQLVDQFKQPMVRPSTTVYDLYSGNNVPFNVRNSIMIQLVGDILDNIYTDTLREEEGGTYGASTNASINPEMGMWNLLYVFMTNEEQQESLINRADAELMNLLQNGADEANFTKAKEAMVKQYEINSRKNQYWNSMLVQEEIYPEVRWIEEYNDTLQSITREDLNEFMKNLYNGQNRIQVIMEGVQAE